MIKSSLLSLALIASILLIPVHAAAGSCVQSDMTGSWHVYVFSAYGGGYWARFGMKINQKGKITIKSVVDSFGRETTVSSAPEGVLTLSPTCFVTGSIKLTSSTHPVNIRIDYGTMNKSKDTFGAVGLDADTSYPCTITGIKR